MLIWGFPGYTLSQERDPKYDKKVSVYTERSGDAFHVIAANKNRFSVTITVDVDGINYKANDKLPATRVLAPLSSKPIITLSVKEKGKSLKFNTNYSWIMGNIHTRHDDSYLYRLPFGSGKSHKVGQSYNGTFSHRGDSRYAVDFMMPVGTEVFAARGGVVVRAYAGSNRGGSSHKFVKDSNYIIIEHEDGTFGEYAHLRKNGVLVNIGQKIRKGQIIALSGNTGYSSGPHLHFMVSKVKKNGASASLPVTFRTQAGVIKHLKEGNTYTAY